MQRRRIKELAASRLTIKYSITAFAAALVISLVSMGGLGALLYYAAYPVLGGFFGNLNDWDGDWVWGAMVGAGVIWSLSFLAAGLVNRFLQRRGVSEFLRWIVYGGVLWLGAVLVWAVTLTSASQPSPAQHKQELVTCGQLNRAVIEAGLVDALAGALGAAPHIVDGPRCLKTPFNSDMVSMAQVQPDANFDAMSFVAGDDVSEIPLDMLEELYPERFHGLAWQLIGIASSYGKTNHNLAVHVIRLPDGTFYVLMHDGI